jgi:hypothetical protein
VTVLLAVPTVALASHNFADVPDSNPFHTNIARVYGARITAGCGGSNYCPSANVTREQMAAFLARTGGRAATSAGWGTGVPVTGAITDLEVLTIRAGDVSGGTAVVLLTGSISGFTFDASGCPCQVFVYLASDAAGTLEPIGYLQVDAESSSGYGLDGTSLTTLVTVPTGVTQTFRMKVVNGGGAALSVFGELEATVFPFASDGSNPSLPFVVSQPATGDTAPGR